jgi:hypothetical protein
MSECFIWLSGATWTGLNTLATFAAVLVALYLPKYQEVRQNKNISILIEKELDGNYALLEKTETMPHLEFKVAVAEHISLKIWNEFKFKLAVYSSEKYSKFEDANVVLEKVLVFRSDFLAGVEPKKTMASQVFEREISSFLSKHREMR